jgi:hypothetical protein
VKGAFFIFHYQIITGSIICRYSGNVKIQPEQLFSTFKPKVSAFSAMSIMQEESQAFLMPS